MKDTMEMLDGKYYLADIKNNESIYLNYCDSLIEVTKKKPSKNFPVIIYFEKGNFFLKRSKYNKALSNFFKINNSLDTNKNDSINALKNMYLGLVKSSINETTSALLFYKKSYNYFSKKQSYQKDEYLSLLMNLTTVYKRLNQFDSAYYYNKKSVELSKKLKDTLFLNFSYFIKSTIDFENKKYDKALIGFHKATPHIINDENLFLLAKSYTLIGVAYDSIKEYKSALKYHYKADSLYSVNKISTSTLKNSFTFLFNHYKNNGNIKKQLLYINKLLYINEINLT